MKVLHFTYTDQKEKNSLRSLLALRIPSDKYFGIDFSELDDHAANSFLYEMQKLMEEHKKQLETVMLEYDIKSSYRQFFKHRMSEVIEEDL